MLSLYFFRVFCLAEWASAFAMRNAPLLNSTTLATTSVNTDEVQSEPTSSTSYLGKVHGESTATGFVEGPPTFTSNPIDLGSIIVSEIATSTIYGGVHFESTESGFADPTSEEVGPTESGDPFRVHFESSAKEFEGVEPVNTAASRITGKPNVVVPTVVTNNGVTLTPVPATSVVIGSQTLTPGGETATVGHGSTKIHLDPSGSPVVVVGDKTSTIAITPAPPTPTVIEGQTLSPGGAPVTVGSGSHITTYSINEAGQTIAVAQGSTSTLPAPAAQVFTIGDITATAEATNYQYLLASSILAINHPITLSGTVIALTTDAAGNTVLVAGGSSTTLPGAHITPAAAPLDIETTVIDGTTQYVISDQTLAPGHPITVDGVPLSITSFEGTTVLVVGGKTTTIAPGAGLTQIAVATTGSEGAGLGVGTSASAAATSAKGGAGQVEAWRVEALGLVVVGFAVLGLG